MDLSYLKIMIEESVMQKGQPATAGSRMLEGFVSPFDAAVISRLERANAKISGRAKIEEFGIGSFPKNNDSTLTDAVSKVLDGSADAVLCNDFSGKTRKLAAENGLYYINPTYGTVSRFGLIPMIYSMDRIGILCRSLKSGFEILSAISGKDPSDGAMFPEESYDYQASADKIRFAVPSNIGSVKLETENKIEFELKYADVYSQVIYILGCAEISNNINRYDGVKFGFRAKEYNGLNDMYIKSRTEGFGVSAKLTAIMGAMVLSADKYEMFYEKSLKIRRLIKESLDFSKYDVVVLPCECYELANLAGLPSISANGLQFVADVKCENKLISAMEAIK